MTKNKILVIPFITAILLFLYIDPYFAWGLFKERNLSMFFSIMLFALFSANMEIRDDWHKKLLCFFVLLLIYMPLSQGHTNFNSCFVSLLVCTIPFARKSFSENTYNYLLTIYSLIIGISCIVWVLSLFKLIPSLGVISPLNELKPYNYSEYPLLVVPRTQNYIRFCGPFDEPGVVGTISVFFLTISKFNLKDKRLWPIMITGVLSLSFFFYSIILAYYMVVPLLKKSNKFYGVFTILLIIVGYIAIRDNSLMQEYIFSRFEWDSTRGTFSGNNRLGVAASELFESIIGTREFYFGIDDYSYYEESLLSSASIALPIMKYGFIFVFFYILFFLVYGWKYKTSTIPYLFFAFVLIGTLFQRPFLTEPEFLFCFSMMAMNIIEERHKHLVHM